MFALKPDVLVETGVCLGGSLLFHSSILALLGHGRVIGVERTLTPDVRAACASSREVPDSGRRKILPPRRHCGRSRTRLLARSGKVMVVLDSDHSAAHVAKELKSYAPLVTPGSCIIVEDAIMSDLSDVPWGSADWKENNPGTAIHQFLGETGEFCQETPAWLFNNSKLKSNTTYWPGGWLWRKPL